MQTDVMAPPPTSLAERFDRDGFVVFEDFVHPAACEALRDRANQIVTAFEPGRDHPIGLFHQRADPHLR